MVRAFNMQSVFVSEFEHHMDKQTSAWLLLVTSYMWFSQRIDMAIALCLAGCVIAGFIAPGRD